MGTQDQPPRKKTIDYYLCLLFVVIPLRALVVLSPIAMAVLAANQLGYAGPVLHTPLAILLLLYFAAESIFTLYYVYAKEAAQPLHPNPPQIVTAHANRQEPMESPLAFFDKLFYHIDDIPTFFLGHFYGVPFDQLSCEDVQRWCAFCFFSKSWDQATASDRSEIDIMVARIFEMAKRPMPPLDSTRPAHAYLQPNLEPFQATARPLLLYIATLAGNFLCSMWLMACGFRSYQATKEIRYWHRPAVATETDEPLVFLHGVGIGLLTYAPFFWTLFGKESKRQILLLDMPYVAMQLADAVPDKDETLDAIWTMLRHHNIHSAHWMGHSFGSIVMSWVCQENPTVVSYLTFFDPIVFALWLHDGIYNIMYREPATGFDLVLWYFGSQEIGIARTMRRHLCWYESVLFPENLPRHPETNHVLASIFLSEKDCIVDAPAVYAHLQRGVRSHKAPSATPLPIQVTLWPSITHGEMVLYPSAHSDVLATLASRAK
ncbi:Aste57867_1990 [Aphanomyces stellatus]|uniref:Aste57867_1990 protein n=1 Tax=Aphanomyces stellatus TaxID=120398 RepID=A0A485K7Y4_9STRA|nr:hypothetical protein As57867_001988 [Aphanomyces stellatus]VFT79195.1 Aste57867_1990 [Aphanomyces stellatus]